MNEESEMVDGFFSYEKKTCRGLVATYTNCTLNMQMGHQLPGSHVDEIMIDYSKGKIQLAETETGQKILEDFIIDLILHDGNNVVGMAPAIEDEEGYNEEDLPPEKNYMDASIALAMLDQKLSTMPQPNYGVPDLSKTFGKYVEENREKDGLLPKDK